MADFYMDENNVVQFGTNPSGEVAAPVDPMAQYSTPTPGLYQGQDWQAINGVIYARPGAQVPPEIQAAFRTASPQELSAIQNPDDPMNNANASFGEALKYGAEFAGAAYGLGNFLPGAETLAPGAGATSAAPTGLEAAEAAIPGAGAAPIVDPSWGVNPALGADDALDAFQGKAFTDAGPTGGALGGSPLPPEFVPAGGAAPTGGTGATPTGESTTGASELAVNAPPAPPVPAAPLAPGAGDVPQIPPLEGVSTAPTIPDAAAPAGAAATGGLQGLMDKITGANPLTLAGLGLGGANLLSAGKKSSIPDQLTALAANPQAASKSLLNEAATGPLAGIGPQLIGQASTGPSATLASDLVTESKTGPVATTANDLITQYQTGQINPSDQFNIDRWKAAQIAAAKNYYSKAGIPDSSTARHAISEIEAQAVAMQDAARQGLLTKGLAAFTANNQLTAEALQAQSLAQNMISQGLNAETVRQSLIQMGLSEDQVASTMLSTAISAQAQQDQAFTQASSSALQSLLLLQALQSKTPATQAAVGK